MEIINENKIAYIYNFKQSDYYIKNGILPVGCGYGRMGDAYLEFINNSKYKEVFRQWCDICKMVKE